MTTPTRHPVRIPGPRTLTLPPKGHQPKKAEHEDAIDMPGMSDKRLRETFFRPFRFVKETK